LDPDEFKAIYGLPPYENAFDYVLVGRLPPGRAAVSRPAIPSGSNPGGSMEIVVMPNTIQVEDIINLK